MHKHESRFKPPLPLLSRAEIIEVADDVIQERILKVGLEAVLDEFRRVLSGPKPTGAAREAIVAFVARHSGCAGRPRWQKEGGMS
jgi:hypothetical protein